MPPVSGDRRRHRRQHLQQRRPLLFFQSLPEVLADDLCCSLRPEFFFVVAAARAAVRAPIVVGQRLQCVMLCGTVHTDHTIICVICVTTARWMERIGERILTTQQRGTMFGIAPTFSPTWPALIDLHRRKDHTSVVQHLRCSIHRTVANTSRHKHKGQRSAKCGPTSGAHEPVVGQMPVQHSCCPPTTIA